MPEFDHSDIPAPFNPREAFSRRQSDHRGVLNSQALALRAQQQIISENIAQQRFGLQQQKLELDQMRAQAEMAKEAAMIRQQMQTEAHVAGAISGLARLVPTDPEYTTRMAEVFQANPMARMDPTVHALVSSHLKVRDTIDTTSAQIKASRERIQMQKDAAMALRDDAKAREALKWKEEQNRKVAENTAAGDVAKDLGLKPSGVSAGGNVTFGREEKQGEKTENPDTWEAYNKELAAARKSMSIPVAKDAKDQMPLPPEIQAQFEARGSALTKGGAAQPTATSMAPKTITITPQEVEDAATGKAPTIAPNITPEEHAKLKPGDAFFWNGQRVIKK